VSGQRKIASYSILEPWGKVGGLELRKGVPARRGLLRRLIAQSEKGEIETVEKTK